MALDVTSLVGRRNDERWNRTAVGDILERMSLSDPRKTAFIAADDAVLDARYARVTYREADETANRMANGLLGLGLQRGDRVAMLAENSVEAYLTKLAIAKAGLVVAPINTMMAPDMIEHMLRHIEARVAVVERDLWVSHGASFAAAGVQPIVAIAGTEPLPAGATDFHEFVSAASPESPEVRIHGDDIWEILLTSGTTAMPKAVMVSHTYSYMATLGFTVSNTRGLEHEAQLVQCTFLPVIFHVGDHAYVLPALMAGGTVVLGRRHTSAAVAAAVTEHRATMLWGGSPQFLEDLARELRENPGLYDFTSVEVIIYGWNSVRPALRDELTEACGGRLAIIGVFGQTEAIACYRFFPHRWEELYRETAPRINYVGLPSPLLGSQLVDEEGRSLEERPGVPGEAVYRSPAMMSGYYKDADATAQVFRDGWFHSGDMCTYDENGLRIMVDRYKDVVKSGGENVSSIRVEAVLNQHPAVASSAVVGVPDDRWGELVTAVVTLKPGADLDEEAVIAFCRTQLAGYETPKRVIAMEALPTTVGGKVQKHRLRDMLAGAGT